MNKVVIHVSGGVAELVTAPKDLVVEILDFDNFGNVPDMGSNNKYYKCTNCQKESTEFEWNAATMSEYGEDIERIQEAMRTIGKGMYATYWYKCPICFHDEDPHLIMQNS